MKDLPEDRRLGTHYTDDQMIRRLKIHRDQNMNESETRLLNFFIRTIGQKRI